MLSKINMKTKILLSSFLFLLFFALGIYEAKAIEYGQMGGRPTYYDPSIPDSQSWFIYSLDPGVTKEDSLTVANLYEESWVAVIYAADSIKSSSGGFALRQLSEPKEAVGSWVKFYPDPKPEFANKIFEEKKTIDEVCKVSGEDLEKNYELDGDKIRELNEWCKGKDLVELEMGSGEKKELLFVISIPADADVGEHTGGILIQKKSKDEAEQGNGSKVMLTTRVGVRIYETVPGEIIRKLNFSDFRISKNFSEFFLPWDKIKKEKFKEYLITSKINNPGNASTDFSEKINIYNKITRKAEVIEGRNFQILRGDDFVSSLAWKGPRLAYLNFQKEYRYKDSNGNEQVIQSQAINKWFIPWREMVIFILFALVAGAFYFAWKKYQNKYYGGIGWVDYIIKEGDTIQSLSTKFGVDWKVLVKTNKLKAPYILEAGHTIKVPSVDTKEDVVESLPNNDSIDESIEKIEKPVKQNIINLKQKSVESSEEISQLGKDVVEENEVELEEVSNEISYPVDTVVGNIDEDSINGDLFFGGSGAENKEVDLSVTQSEKVEESFEKEINLKKDYPKSTKSLDAKKKEKENQDYLKEEIPEDLIASNNDEEEELFIKGEREDSRGSISWLVYLLLSVIVILLAGVLFLLYQNKKIAELKLNNESKIIIENDSKEESEKIETNEVVESPENVTKEEAPLEEVAISEIEVKVLNGSGVAGMAGKIKDFLSAKEYKSVEAGNYSSEEVEGTIVYYKEEKFKTQAQWLSDMLKDKEIKSEIKLGSSEEELSADIVVVLGK